MINRNTQILSEKAAKVLVAGGSGFIGSHLVARLLERGYFVRIRESYEKPQETYDINVGGTEKLLRAGVKHKVQRFIFSSSGKIYGNARTLPVTEDDLGEPLTPYSLTKYRAENLCEQFSRKHGLNVMSLRYFSVYGPGQRLHDGLIGEILANALNMKHSVLNATRGMERDFTYIDDVIHANLLCLSYASSRYEAFNIGSGQSHSVQELIGLIGGILKKNIEINFGEPLEGTAVKTRANISKANKLLDYRPKFFLAEGLSRTIEWIINQSKNYAESQRY